MTTPRPLQISCATDIELCDLVVRSPEFGPDFRDHIHAEFARRFPYIEVSTIARNAITDADVFLRTETRNGMTFRNLMTVEHNHD